MLFFEYYTKYNSSPTEHQVFTSPPIERSIYFVHHHVLPLSVFIFRNAVRSASSCFGVRKDHYGARGLWPDHACARGLWSDHARALGLLARPRSCSRTSRQTTARLVLGYCLDHSPTMTRGLHHSLLDCSPTTAWGFRCSLLDLCSETASTTLRPRLGDFASQLHVTGNSHTVGIFFLIWTLLQGSYLAFQQARGLHRYDAPADASRIACMTIGFST
jgi:hypothetical protein